jgi:hypothetical protein
VLLCRDCEGTRSHRLPIGDPQLNQRRWLGARSAATLQTIGRCRDGRIGAVAVLGGWLLQRESFRNCSTSRVAPLHSEQISATRRNRGRRVSAAADVPRSSLIDSIAMTPAVRSYDLAAPTQLDPAASSRSSVRMQIRLSARRDTGPAIGQPQHGSAALPTGAARDRREASVSEPTRVLPAPGQMLAAGRKQVGPALCC